MVAGWDRKLRPDSWSGIVNKTRPSGEESDGMPLPQDGTETPNSVQHPYLQAKLIIVVRSVGQCISTSTAI